MRSIFAVALLSLGLAAAASAEPAGAVDAGDDAAKPFIVKIHADWCGTCTRLNGTMAQLEAESGDRVRIVVLDVTNKERVAASRLEADRLGIRAFFDQYKSKTGVVGVLDGETREPVAVLKGETNVAAYQKAVDEATAGKTS